jgi:hypothetical protein
MLFPGGGIHLILLRGHNLTILTDVEGMPVRTDAFLDEGNVALMLHKIKKLCLDFPPEGIVDIWNAVTHIIRKKGEGAALRAPIQLPTIDNVDGEAGKKPDPEMQFIPHPFVGGSDP